ncbi:MAG: hypothetical protein Q9170_003516, partial [Blastenia crenularia]
MPTQVYSGIAPPDALLQAMAGRPSKPPNIVPFSPSSSHPLQSPAPFSPTSMPLNTVIPQHSAAPFQT